MIRRAKFEAAGGFDETLRMGIDWDLWLRLSVENAFEFVPQPLLSYRVGHAGQMSKNRETRQLCSDRIMAKFLEQNPGLLAPGVIKRGYAYTFVNRAYAARDSGLSESNRWLIRLRLRLKTPDYMASLGNCSTRNRRSVGHSRSLTR